MKPLQQNNPGFIRHGSYIGSTYFPTGFLHSVHSGCDGSCLHRAGNGINFRRSALAELPVASPAIQAIEI
jgi:hypothetical protein